MLKYAQYPHVEFKRENPNVKYAKNLNEALLKSIVNCRRGEEISTRITVGEGFKILHIHGSSIFVALLLSIVTFVFLAR